MWRAGDPGVPARERRTGLLWMGVGTSSFLAEGVFASLVLIVLSQHPSTQVPNGMDRSCEATIYPVLDKPHTTRAFQDRRKIEALLRPA